ncbi:MAG: YfiM family protein [Schleiferiaceae bacterium]|nr:YfiM family protein [Schleiferiaceae bacterium]
MKGNGNKILIVVLCCFQLHNVQGQQASSFFTPSDTLHKSRLAVVGFGVGGAATASLVGLYQLWYANYPQSQFHFYNDNDNWLQMDKVGHAMTAWYTGEVSHDVLRWAGVERKKAIWIGGLTGLTYLTAIEIMDGFSKEWGFSTGDMLANMAGSALFISQQLLWDEQRIRMKFSFQQSAYAPLRPELLGTSFMTSILKDYNGQVYWLSFNPRDFTHWDWYPKWLNLAVGYSGDGMVTGAPDPAYYAANHPDLFRQRQLYLSLDLDLRRIKVRQPWLRATLNAINFIKIPAPAYAINFRSANQFHGFYF